MVPAARQRRMAEASQANPAEGAWSHGGGEDGGEDGGGGDGNSSARVQDRFLPTASVTRIMKKALPNHAKVTKEVKETMQECVSEFIGFITSQATELCMKLKKRTINGDDLLKSMATLGFEDYVPLLKLYLGKYRQWEGREEMGGSYPNTNTTGEYQVLQQNFLAQNMNYANHQGGEGSASIQMGVSHPITNTTGEYQVLQQNFLAQNLDYASQQNFLAQNMDYASHQFQSGDL